MRMEESYLLSLNRVKLANLEGAVALKGTSEIPEVTVHLDKER